MKDVKKILYNTWLKNSQKREIRIRKMIRQIPTKPGATNTPQIKNLLFRKKRAKRRTKERVEKDVKQEGCGCRRYCSSPDLNMREPRVIFKHLGNGEEEIPHTIKWLEEIYRNVERDWHEFMKTSLNEPPDRK